MLYICDSDLKDEEQAGYELESDKAYSEHGCADEPRGDQASTIKCQVG